MRAKQEVKEAIKSETVIDDKTIIFEFDVKSNFTAEFTSKELKEMLLNDEIELRIHPQESGWLYIELGYHLKTDKPMWLCASTDRNKEENYNFLFYFGDYKNTSIHYNPKLSDSYCKLIDFDLEYSGQETKPIEPVNDLPF